MRLRHFHSHWSSFLGAVLVNTFPSRLVVNMSDCGICIFHAVCNGCCKNTYFSWNKLILDYRISLRSLLIASWSLNDHTTSIWARPHFQIQTDIPLYWNGVILVNETMIVGADDDNVCRIIVLRFCEVVNMMCLDYAAAIFVANLLSTNLVAVIVELF